MSHLSRVILKVGNHVGTPGHMILKRIKEILLKYYVKRIDNVSVGKKGLIHMKETW